MTGNAETLENVLGHFEGVVERSGCYMTRCPAHADDKMSLSIRQAEDGKILLHCFADCELEDVLRESGLKITDLFPGGNGFDVNADEIVEEENDCISTGETGSIQHQDEDTGIDPLLWLSDYCSVPLAFLEVLPIGRHGSKIAFRFGDNTILRIRSTKEKKFYWEPGEQFTPPLWPIPADQLPEEIWLTEGETDCIVLLHIGLPAFAITKGAGGTLSIDHVQALKKRGVQRINVCFDADDAGRRGREKQAEVICKAGLKAQTVDLCKTDLLDPLLGQKDLRDIWKSLFGDPGALLEKLKTLPETYGALSFQVRLDPVDASDLATGEAPEKLPSLPLLDQEGYIIKSWGHVLSGYPKVGKTELLITSVEDWVNSGVKVLWLSEESEEVWRLRIQRRKHFTEGLKLLFALGAPPSELLSKASASECDVIIVDSLRSLLQMEESDNTQVARVICGWESALQGKTRIYVHHERKSGGDHGHAIAGVGAFLGSVDRALEVQRDKQNSVNRRTITVLSRIEVPSDLMYEMVENRLTAIGAPSKVEFRELCQRLEDVLDDEWRKTSDVVEMLGDPKPSDVSARNALNALVADGIAERNPPEEKKGATYKWRLKQRTPIATAPETMPVLTFQDQLTEGAVSLSAEAEPVLQTSEVEDDAGSMAELLYEDPAEALGDTDVICPGTTITWVSEDIAETGIVCIPAHTPDGKLRVMRESNGVILELEASLNPTVLSGDIG